MRPGTIVDLFRRRPAIVGLAVAVALAATATAVAATSARIMSMRSRRPVARFTGINAASDWAIEAVTQANCTLARSIEAPSELIWPLNRDTPQDCTMRR